MTVLPADSHVHSEWSWDAQYGSMERTCERASHLGLPAVAFTEHVDHTRWDTAGQIGGDEHLARFVAPDGVLTPPAFDLDGYLESVERCRDRYPDLRIITGMELGEPHRHAAVAAELLNAGQFDRVLGSLHCLRVGERFFEPPGLYRERPAAEVIRSYLAEIPDVVTGSDAFSVLAHIDYPVRYWPATAGPFGPMAFEEEFRHALSALAAGGRAMEVNTRLPLDPVIVGWWRDVGGTAVTFGSDAHEPTALALGFAAAAAMVEAYGFRPGRDPQDFWTRSG